MDKYIDANQLRSEIDRRIKVIVNSPLDGGEMDAINGARCLELMSFRKYIDSIPEQPEDGLDDEIERVCAEIEEKNPQHRGLKPSGIAKIARHFAEWGAEQALQEIRDEIDLADNE